MSSFRTFFLILLLTATAGSGRRQEPLIVERQDGPFEEQGKGGDPGQKGAQDQIFVHLRKIGGKECDNAQTEGQAERTVGIMDNLKPDEENFPAQGARKHYRSQVVDGCGVTGSRRQGQHQEYGHIEDPDYFQIHA